MTTAVSRPPSIRHHLGRRRPDICDTWHPTLDTRPQRSTQVSDKLALAGGPKLIPDGTVKPWPPITAEDEQLVLESLRSDTHSWGPNCDALQKEWNEWNGNQLCWTTNSGTSALHMAVVASGASFGDEILTPAYSWTSSVTCILHAGCVPVFVDIDFPTANFDPAKIEAAISERTKAILAVHLHGLPCEMDAIMAIAQRHDLVVIEDCCQAHGALYKGKKVGTIGHCAAFSLNSNKMLMAGEGGLFVTDDDALYKRAQSLVLFGDFREPVDEPGYHFYGLGYQYRNSDLIAGLARTQLKRLDEYIADARELFHCVTGELEGTPGLILPLETGDCRTNAYNYLVRLDPAGCGYDGPPQELREAVVKAVTAEGVPALVWQRRILPEMGAIRARDAFGNGYPWAGGRPEVDYHPSQFPEALRHVDNYFIIGGLRTPNTPKTGRLIGQAVRKVMTNLDQLDIEAVAKTCDRSLYERGWAQQR
ncbi:MAG: glutamine--scyllo-inositol aminotransferase [Armatimonadetes bacterium CG_4_10_14_3_um_filter_66_18]|nr:MAG: glutamine--scyllo-inositol aminotransferase [Armatimonadetes bacterium CG06_land_8_20_14_3_00_66_21]PIX44820.1 MAG: glutamine--scyllo-inositol aminotransferase [Armatimonadetes bacterium CG_4_8_14_3_um_filter_66_20]PIY48840.1 MAG: glutamine--scyllo-inositol aminotransferase [Armatimonadetes bacterium CG_4_10_14_3_um_filter_66_18]PIZ40684.1 MAG: glutamine--scyllo-inositol aminotransferase [Armatimonadetes bacterium CG_4_10_14_0_8_um_filter_66_14]PJB65109.1 MAG: glutamine--scyllo-inositol